MIFILFFLLGLLVYAAFKTLATGFYTVRPDERAVLTSFGRAQRLAEATASDPQLTEEELDRYDYPAVRVIPPGGPYFKWPWQEIHKVSIATQSVSLTWDPSKYQETIEAVTRAISMPTSSGSRHRWSM